MTSYIYSSWATLFKIVHSLIDYASTRVMNCTNFRSLPAYTNLRTPHLIRSSIYWNLPRFEARQVPCINCILKQQIFIFIEPNSSVPSSRLLTFTNYKKTDCKNRCQNDEWYRAVTLPFLCSDVEYKLLQDGLLLLYTTFLQGAFELFPVSPWWGQVTHHRKRDIPAKYLRYYVRLSLSWGEAAHQREGLHTYHQPHTT